MSLSLFDKMKKNNSLSPLIKAHQKYLIKEDLPANQQTHNHDNPRQTHLSWYQGQCMRFVRQLDDNNKNLTVHCNSDLSLRALANWIIHHSQGKISTISELILIFLCCDMNSKWIDAFIWRENEIMCFIEFFVRPSFQVNALNFVWKVKIGNVLEGYIIQ